MRFAPFSRERTRTGGGAGVYQCGPVVNIPQFVGHSTARLSSITKSAGSRRRALLRWVQIALKPASKTLGLDRVFIRDKGLMYVIADSAFKRMQVDARAYWLDTGQHPRRLALRTER